MKILELRLTTPNPGGQAAFYSGVLGLPASVAPSAAAEIVIGSTRLVFSPISAGGANPVYHFAFNIPPSKLAEAKGWLSSRVPLLEKDGADEFRFEDWNADAIYFRDPAGNIAELIARHNLPDDTPGPFAPSDLLCVSEMGLVALDVPALVRALRGELGLPAWLEESDTFSTLGDERGLLIVVQKGRPWFPTDIPASPQSAVVVIEGVREGRYAALGYEVMVRADTSVPT